MAEVLARDLFPSGIEVSSAGLAAADGMRAAAEAEAAVAEIGLDLTNHRSKKLTPRLVKAALIMTMTAAQAERVGQEFPDANVISLSEKAGCGSDIDDPFGCDIKVYRRTRDQLRELLTVIATGQRNMNNL